MTKEMTCLSCGKIFYYQPSGGFRPVLCHECDREATKSLCYICQWEDSWPGCPSGPGCQHTAEINKIKKDENMNENEIDAYMDGKKAGLRIDKYSGVTCPIPNPYSENMPERHFWNTGIIDGLKEYYNFNATEPKEKKENLKNLFTPEQIQTIMNELLDTIHMIAHAADAIQEYYQELTNKLLKPDILENSLEQLKKVFDKIGKGDRCEEKSTDNSENLKNVKTLLQELEEVDKENSTIQPPSHP